MPLGASILRSQLMWSKSSVGATLNLVAYIVLIMCMIHIINTSFSFCFDCMSIVVFKLVFVIAC